MKRTIFIILSLLAVFTTLITFAGKRADASAQTAALEEIVLADLDLGAQADTLGGSTGGAPDMDSYELYMYDYAGEKSAACGDQEMTAVTSPDAPEQNAAWAVTAAA